MTSRVKAALEGRYSWNMTAVLLMWPGGGPVLPGAFLATRTASDELIDNVIRTFSLPSLLEISTAALAGLSLYSV